MATTDCFKQGFVRASRSGEKKRLLSGYLTPKDKNLMSGGAERALRSPPQIPGPQSRFVGGICKGDLKLMLPLLDNYLCPGGPDPGVGA